MYTNFDPYNFTNFGVYQYPMNPYFMQNQLPFYGLGYNNMTSPVSSVSSSDTIKTPDTVSFKSKETQPTVSSTTETDKKGMSASAIIGLGLGAAAVGAACLILHKGSKVLEGNGSIKEKFEAGWKELRGKGSKPAGTKAEEPKAEDKKPAETKAEVPKAAELKTDVIKSIDDLYKELNGSNNPVNGYNQLHIKLLDMFSNMSAEEIHAFLNNSSNKQKGEAYFNALQELCYKEKSIQNYQALVSYLEKCKAGNYKLVIEADNSDKNIKLIASCLLRDTQELAKLYKVNGNPAKELEVLSKLDIKKCKPEFIADVAMDLINKNDTKNGLELAIAGYEKVLPTLTNGLLPNSEQVSEAVPVLNAFIQTCDKLGNKDLSKIISLVKKGGLDGKEALTKDDIVFLKEHNVSFEHENKPNGGFVFHHQPYLAINKLINDYYKSLTV